MNTEQSMALQLQGSGLTRSEIAKQMNKSERQVKSLLERARRYLNAPQGQREAIASAGLDMSTARHGWRVVPRDDGGRDSVFWKAEDVARENWLETVADAFKDIPAYEPVQSEFTASDLCAVYPLFDAHFGMHAWGAETGQDDYDLSLADRDIRSAFAGLGALVPGGGDAVLILGGDTLHADDGKNETPKSKHKLDVDGRHHKVLDAAIRAVAWAVEYLAQKHERVIVRVLAGNHDPSAHMVLTFALAERYRNVSRITVDKSPMDLFMHRHGNCLIAAHHGDKSPPDRLAMMLADVCPYWSETRERVMLTGHIHHMSSKDYPGVQWRSMRAFCPPDAYGAGFAPRRELRAIVFDAERGVVLEARDGIRRD